MLHDNYELVDVKFSGKSITFGHHNFDNILNELIFIGKRYIIRMKIENAYINYVFVFN